MIQEKGNTDSLSRENGGLEVTWERGWLFVIYAFIHLGGGGEYKPTETKTNWKTIEAVVVKHRKK